MPTLAPRLRTVDDYMRLDDDIRVELIDGEFFVTPAPTEIHQEALDLLLVELLPRVNRLGLGRVVSSPFDVILGKHDVVQPDIVFIAKAHLHRLRKRLYGPPDIAIEVLSPGHSERDRLVKRDRYLKHGVPEYWMIDTEARTVEIRDLVRGRWKVRGIFGRQHALESPRLPGISIPVRKIFPE